VVGSTSINPPSSHAATLPASLMPFFPQEWLSSSAVSTRGIPHHLYSLQLLLDCSVTQIRELSWKATPVLKKEGKIKIQPDRTSDQIHGLAQKCRSSHARKVLEQTARSNGGATTAGKRTRQPHHSASPKGKEHLSPAFLSGLFRCCLTRFTSSLLQVRSRLAAQTQPVTPVYFTQVASALW